MKAIAGFAALGAVLSFWAPAMAQEAETPPTPDALSALYACAEVSDDAARLACFDGATARMRAAQDSGDLVAVDRSQVETMQRESFGFNLPSISSLLPSLTSDRSEPPQLQVELEVERLIQNPNGRFTFVMSDGQQWTQVESTPVRNVRAGDAVTIRRAALGSYLLISERGGASVRVRRVE
jgi:hypothetical protein